ncbi:MAG: hypothetical protein M1835_000020 [Candelina submexicana]|nr:MAG: hypothetical protein M1835_000020 [Candelina submexicana]
MEVFSATPFQPSFTSSTFAMNGSMDIDMDVDMDQDEEIVALEAEAMRIESQPSFSPQLPKQANAITSSDTSTSESLQLTPHKVHIRGLDNLTTEDIKTFAREYFPGDQPIRIEWIDDTSANMVYETPAIALKALTSFSAFSDKEPSLIPTSQLRLAKQLVDHLDTTLHVRLATVSDVKAPRASDKSRFYLLHPEHDPRERRRQEGGRRGRDERRYADDNRDYRRRRYDDREHRRRRDGDQEQGFSADLYDDTTSPMLREGSSERDRRGSQASFSSGDDRRGGGRRRVRFNGDSERDLFQDRKRLDNGRLRGRSASPRKDRNGDHDLLQGDTAPTRRRIRERSYSPRPPFRDRYLDSHREENAGKELIIFQPILGTDVSAELRGATSAGHSREAFGNGPPSSRKKELFPKKVGTSNHRRSDAFDAADETADLFATGMAVPFTDGASDLRPKARSLADRISKGTALSFGRLNDENSTLEDRSADLMEGYSIRGAAKQQDQGFTIRGTAGATTNETVKELFPLKGNAGKELFADKLQGRGGRRRKAEDMFY